MKIIEILIPYKESEENFFVTWLTYNVQDYLLTEEVLGDVCMVGNHFVCK